MTFTPESARTQFPALARTVNGRPAAYLDGPGGTQVSRSVIDAVAGFMTVGGSNLGGPFVTSEETLAVTEGARRAVADLVGAGTSDEIVFGQNMTSLTLSVSRALGRYWRPGDEIVVTRLDHDANISPWVIAAERSGATVRFVDFDRADGSLDPERFDSVLSAHTRLVAVTHASNALGTVVDVAGVVAKAHAAGALVYVDAVHYTPHGLVDVAATGCDFLAASAYKFFGPHTSFVYGKQEHLAGFDAVKIRPAPSDPPGKWESGTQSFESLAGVAAAVDYLASMGDGASRRVQLTDAMQQIAAYEVSLSERFIEGLAGLANVRLFGPQTAAGRTPTFAIDVAGRSAGEGAALLGEQGIFVWHGHYYALEVMQHLGVLDSGGLIRIGFVHYNTADEVDRTLEALDAIT